MARVIKFSLVDVDKTIVSSSRSTFPSEHVCEDCYTRVFLQSFMIIFVSLLSLMVSSFSLISCPDKNVFI